MRPLVLLLLTSFVCGCLASSSSISSDLINLSFRRSIDLRGHVEEIVNHVDVKNNGKTPIAEYIVAIPANRAKHLAFIEGTSRDNTVHYPTTLTTVSSSSSSSSSSAPSGTVFYRVTLDSPIPPDGEKKFNIITSYTQTLVPYPATITQNENQLCAYENNAIVYTPYTTKTQSTVIKLASSHLESWTKKNGKHAGDQLEYGPFNDIPPFDTSRPITVHFQNNAPFATATKLRKIIEISHFGNLAVEEHYQLRHSGATLKGHFSRHDYQSRPGQSPASFRQITAILPATATDLYYRDRIGNVSTSHVRESDDGTIVMEVQPRYPMMGGWKTDFYMGYNVPAHEFLSYSADSRSTYILNITFGTPFPQLNVDEQQIRIILPEGASNIQWATPFDIDSEETDVHYTYLDTTGRPVLVLKKHNVVRLHNQYFQVSYTYTPTAMIRKPLLLVFAFFLFFLASMAYARFELTIAPKKQHIVTSKRSGRIGTLINTVVVSSQQLLAAYESKNNDRIIAAESVRNEVTTALNELATSDVGEIAKKLDGTLTKAKNEAKAYVKAETSALTEEARQQNDKLSTTIEQCETLLSQLVSK